MRRRTLHRPYAIDRLENRRMLTSVSWDGGGDGHSWIDPLNWSGNLAPSGQDDVTIDVSGDVVIDLADENSIISSLICNEQLILQNANLTIQNGGAFNAQLEVDGWLNCNGGGLRFDGAVLLGNGGSSSTGVINFGNVSQTLRGTGQIDRVGESNAQIVNSADQGNRTLTIEAGLEINLGGQGMIQCGTFGTVINNAEINISHAPPANASDPRFLVSNHYGTFINRAALNITNDAIVYIENLINEPGGVISADDSDLHITGGSETDAYRWDNNGQITAVNSRVWLGGYFQPENIGSLTRIGSANYPWTIEGVFDLAGQTFTMGPTIGSLILSGTMKNGTLNATDNYKLSTLSASTLDRMILNAPASGGAIVLNNLVLNSTYTVGSGSLDFGGTIDQTLTGMGSISMISGGSVVNSNRDPATFLGCSLTIGSGITMTAGPSSSIYSQYGMIENYGRLGYVQSSSTCKLQQFGNQIINHGIVTLASGARVQINGLLNSADGQLIATNAEVFLDGGWQAIYGSWINQGQFSFDHCTLHLKGEFRPNGLGNYTRIAGTVYLEGNLGLESGSFTLNQASGDWILKGGSIREGTFNAIDGARLLGQGGTLDNITLNTDLACSDGSITVMNGLELNSTISFNQIPSGSDKIRFSGNVSVDVNGTGAIVLTGNAESGIHNDLISNSLGMPVSIGSGIEIYVGPGNTITSRTEGSITIHGELNVVGGSNTLTTLGTSTSRLINNGIIRLAGGAKVSAYGFVTLPGSSVVVNDSTLTLFGKSSDSTYSFDNDGSINLANSTLNLSGLFDPTQIGTITRVDSTAFITGTVDCTTSPLLLNSATGLLVLASTGRIRGGTVQASAGQQLIARGGTLEAVIMNSPITVETAATLYIEKGLTLNSTMTLANATVATTIEFRTTGAQTFAGNGTVVGDPDGEFKLINSTRLSNTSTNGQTVTIGSGLTLDFARAGSITGTYLNSKLINQGVINVNGNHSPTASFSLGAVDGKLTLSNAGSVNFLNGAIGTIHDLTGNTNSISVTGAGTQATLDGVYTLNGLVRVASEGWLNVFGDWTVNAGININSTAAFKYYVPSVTYLKVKFGLLNGYANGHWNGFGLHDSIAATNISTTLGYAQASDVDDANGRFRGVAVDPESIIVHHTLDCDFNLDHAVNFNDLLTIAQNYGQSDRDFFRGDMNFTFDVDFNDLLRCAQQYNLSVFEGGKGLSESHGSPRLKPNLMEICHEELG